MANTRDEKLGADLLIGGDGAKQHFARLVAQRSEIEKQLGFDLDWQELPDSKACRIASWYPNVVLEDEGRWEEYMKWLTQRLVRMDQVLRPIVKALP